MKYAEEPLDDAAQLSKRVDNIAYEMFTLSIIGFSAAYDTKITGSPLAYAIFFDGAAREEGQLRLPPKDIERAISDIRGLFSDQIKRGNNVIVWRDRPSIEQSCGAPTIRIRCAFVKLSELACFKCDGVDI